MPAACVQGIIKILGAFVCRRMHTEKKPQVSNYKNKEQHRKKKQRADDDEKRRNVFTMSFSRLAENAVIQLSAPIETQGFKRSFAINE